MDTIRRSGGWLLVLVAALLVAVPQTVAPARSAPRALRADLQGPSSFPVSHVVIVLMENHAYNSLFGAYCNANNASQVAVGACPSLANGTPPTAWSPGIPVNPKKTSLGKATAFFWHGNQLAGLGDCSHNWNASHRSWDAGRMDGFVLNCRGSREPMGEYNGTTVPTYWETAQEFGLGDATFSSVLTSSLGNHWFPLAGNAPAVGFKNSLSTYNVSQHHVYLNVANATPTIQDLLRAMPGVSWRFYDFGLSNYSKMTACGSSTCSGLAYNPWSPLAARNESYPGGLGDSAHFAYRYNFFQDLKNGVLRNVSWIVPQANQSDHPPANVTQGERLVQQVIDAVQGSVFWSSTAVFVVWDEFGGFYDSVPPPQIDANGTGFRSAMLVASPYTPAGLVVHTSLEFESILAFIEWRFGLGCLTARDCRATLPLDFFPLAGVGTRPPAYIYPPSNATYPYPLAPLPAAPYWAPPTVVTPADAD